MTRASFSGRPDQPPASDHGQEKVQQIIGAAQVPEPASQPREPGRRSGQRSPDRRVGETAATELDPPRYPRRSVWHVCSHVIIGPSCLRVNRRARPGLRELAIQ